MILKNDVLASKGSLQGIYGVYQTTNGRTSWKSASRAIWFVPHWNDWAIGELKDIGTKTEGIKSNGDQGDRSPSDVPNEEWNKDGDIIIQCVNDKGKILHTLVSFYLQIRQLRDGIGHVTLSDVFCAFFSVCIHVHWLKVNYGVI